MTFIDPIAERDATGEVAALYEDEIADQGYVSNSAAVFSLRPGVIPGWIGLKNAITAEMDARRYELVTFAAARRLRSSYCMLAHGSVLLERFCGGSRSTTTPPGSTRWTWRSWISLRRSPVTPPRSRRRT